jgi:hypothetical protein
VTFLIGRFSTGGTVGASGILIGSWETNGAVLGSIAEIERFDLPEDYFDTLAGRTRGMTIEQPDAAARRVVRPDRVIWVVVGDKDSIEEGLRGLGPRTGLRDRPRRKHHREARELNRGRLRTNPLDLLGGKLLQPTDEAGDRADGG